MPKSPAPQPVWFGSNNNPHLNVKVLSTEMHILLDVSHRGNSISILSAQGLYNEFSQCSRKYAIVIFVTFLESAVWVLGIGWGCWGEPFCLFFHKVLMVKNASLWDLRSVVGLRILTLQRCLHK